LFYYSFFTEEIEMVIRRWAAVGLFTLTLLHLWGLDPNKSVDKYLLDQWETSDGLPSNTINSIVQTPDGYLWLAGSNSLVRFDGIKFSKITFVDANKDKISPPVTPKPIPLLVNREGDLWIGSNIGLTRCRNGQFETFTTKDGLSENNIRFITEDMQGNLWISFMAGYVDLSFNGKFTPYNASHGLEEKKINAIVEDRSGNMFFATREKGVFSFHEGQFSHYPIPGLDNLNIITMYQDHKEELWIGTNKGLLRVGEESTIKYESRHGLSNDYIMAITEDSERNLWVGTLKGLNRLKRKPDGTIGFESLLKSITVFSLFEDREKSLWIGTENSGLKRLKDSKFTSSALPKTLEEEIIISIFRNREGDTLMGSLGGKLFLFRENRLIEKIEPPGLPGTGISAIAQDNEGNLWLGTIGKGVFQKKDGTFVQFTTREGLADNLVTSIYRDSQDNLWLSTFAGVSVRYHDSTIKSFTSREGLSGKVVNNIYEDKSKNIWITADQGVTFLEKGKIIKANIKYYLNGIPTVSIYEDPSPGKGEGPIFWISTDGAGLIRLRLKDDNFYSYTAEQGMTTNLIYQFFEEEGNFWLMSSNGILRISKKKLNLLAKGGAGRINCISFGKADGMQSTEFHSELSHHSALQTKDGELWFVTKKGISILNPKKIRINTIPPPVVIESVFFDQQSISRHQDANVKPFKGITNFSFQFTAPSFLSPEKIKFQYQLEGFDKDWIYLPPGSERIVHYQNLKPGTYTFKVIACNSDRIWNQTGDSVTFTLKPFFYQTFVFKIVVFLLVVFLLVSAVYFYKKRSVKVKTNLEEPEKKGESENKDIYQDTPQECDLVREHKKKPKYESSNLTPEFARECERKLKHLMEVEKIYRDENISLQSLAKKIGTKPYKLSQILNERMNRGFYDFINYYRIEEAKRILKSPGSEMLKMPVVAGEVGFNTTAAFYKIFKKHTGMTPNQFKEEFKMK
jgi:ligand-binding sensor domain-containing protein/AraC-like DNA-binding protein